MYMLIEDCFRGDFDRIKFDNIPLIILSLELIVFSLCLHFLFCYFSHDTKNLWFKERLKILWHLTSNKRQALRSIFCNIQSSIAEN